MTADTSFHIGDKVVYPNQGVGIIEQIGSRTLGNTVEKFYMLRINGSSLRVMVPFHSVGAVGLRKVIRNGEVQKVLTYLTEFKCDNHTDWKCRFRENSDKMRTGSLMDVAAVLKSLLYLHQSKPLSYREKKMLDRARYLLVSELALARNGSEAEVETMITRALGKSRLKFPEVTGQA